MQIPLILIDPPAPRLQDGVIGQNTAALEALRALIKSDAHRHQSLFFWGAPGSGKSYWLAAWASAESVRCRLIDCRTNGSSDQATEVVALLERTIAELRIDQGPPVLLIDHADTENPQLQRLLFQLYNATRESQRSIVATASAAPSRLSVRGDLATRFAQSLIFELHELDDQEKREALRARAEKLALPLTEDILSYLLTRMPRDLGLLIRVVDSLNQYTLSRQRPATLPLLKELLDSIDARTRPV